MDITSTNSQTPLCLSRVPLDFFISQILGYHSDRKTYKWEWAQAEWSPFKEVANKKRWREKLIQAINEGEPHLSLFIVEQIHEHSDPKFINMALNTFGKYNSLNSTDQSNSIWSAFVGYVLGYCEAAPDHPASEVLSKYIYQANRKMEYVETALWMLIAYQELKLVESGHEIGAGYRNDVNAILVDIEKWMPDISGNGIRSTRYKIINGILNLPRCIPMSDSERKALRRERGVETIRFNSPSPHPVKVDALYKLLDLELLGISTQSLSARQAFKSHINGLMRFAGYFGLIQQQLLQVGLSPESVVEKFSIAQKVQSSFYTDLEIQP